MSKNLEFLCVPGTETRPERDVAGTSTFAAPVRQRGHSFYALQTEATPDYARPKAAFVWGAKAEPPVSCHNLAGGFAVNIAGVPWTLEVTSLKQSCTF